MEFKILMVLIVVYIVLSGAYLAYTLYKDRKNKLEKNISEDVDLSTHDVLEVNHTHGVNSIKKKLWIFIPTTVFIVLAFLIFESLFLGASDVIIVILLIVFIISGICLITCLTIYAIQVYRNEFVTEYKGHSIKVVNKFASLKLYIDDILVDSQNHTFLITVQLSGECEGKTVYAIINTAFFIHCKNITISKRN
ncbi:hypothetical protein OAO42_01845 [Candidatus Izimaplasma bacterium]|nr:hypothetical protein [Candidatus Izimaplasma bacterium]